MRAIRVSLVAAILSMSLGTAHAGIFDCLKGQTITIPNWSPSMSPVYVQQQPAASNGLVDTLLVELLKGFISGGGSKPPATDNSGALERANATLNRIDGKMDRLEVLIVDRLAKVESDVATVAKAQRESTALNDQRQVETLGLVHANTKLIETNTKAISEAVAAIERIQKGSAPAPAATPSKTATDNIRDYSDALTAIAQNPISESMRTGEKKVTAKNLTAAKDTLTVELAPGTTVEVIHKTAKGEAVIRWKVGEADLKQAYLGVVQLSDLVK